MPRKTEKGQQWERDVSKLLSLWVSAGARSDIFWRTRASGALNTNRRKQGGGSIRSQVGDIGLLDAYSPEGRKFLDHFAVECKFTKPKNMWPGESEGWNTVRGWWDKIRLEAGQAGVRPLLVFKSNQRPPIALLQTQLVSNLDERPLMYLPWQEDVSLYLLEDLVKLDLDYLYMAFTSVRRSR